MRTEREERVTEYSEATFEDIKHVDEDGNLCGDTDFESVSKKASLITPVPRGVGNITTSVLSEHLLRSYLK